MRAFEKWFQESGWLEVGYDEESYMRDAWNAAVEACAAVVVEHEPQQADDALLLEDEIRKLKTGGGEVDGSAD